MCNYENENENAKNYSKPRWNIKMARKREHQFLQNLKNFEFDVPLSTIQITGHFWLYNE